MLARAATDAGVEIVERSRVLDVVQDAGAVRVVTDGGTYEAQVLVGADGSGSRVRRAVFGARKETIGRALMTDIAVDAERTPEFTAQTLPLRLPMRQPRNQRLQLVVPVPHRRHAASERRHLRSAPARFHRKGRRAIADDRRTRRGVPGASARRPEAARDPMAFVPDSMVRRAATATHPDALSWRATLPASIR